MRARLNVAPLRDATVVLVLLTIAALPFGPALFDPRIIPAGLDLLQHYSREAFIRLAAAEGVFPLWNPYEFSGFPFQADPQAGVFYPPNLVLRLLPLGPFLTWTAVLHVWLFGTGTYALCRAARAHRGPSFIAAVALMLGGVVIPRIYAGHFDVLRTAAWMPLALACGIRSLDRDRLLPTTTAVVVLACLVLGSYVQFIVYAIAAVVRTPRLPLPGRRKESRRGLAPGELAHSSRCC